mmetsp:Transcript_37768/g.111811  ORF Transcript_37768/g.111811 Transcript_37768/m.111811 type:complete len:341 (+) Transcript_37768:90-1112(+)
MQRPQLGGKLAVALLAVLGILRAHALHTDIARERDLVGWLGETYNNGGGGGVGHDASGGEREYGLVVLSWEPRVFVYRGFLTHTECDELVAMSRSKLTKSGVVDAITGEGKNSDVRTSSGAAFGKGATPTIQRIEERISRLTMTAVGQGEGLQILRYEPGEKYDPHHDYFSHEEADAMGGNRLVTGLMYLSDVEEGGETVFPKVPVPDSQTREAGYSECAMQGLANKPRKGDIVVFWSIRTDGRFEPASLHGSCPVIKGEKWSATKWIHVADLNKGKVVRVKHVPPAPPDVPGCVNKHKLCDHWAEAGECEDNAGFMVGAPGKPGDCLKACFRCDLGPNE